jgi:hypothetical protein
VLQCCSPERERTGSESIEWCQEQSVKEEKGNRHDRYSEEI